MRATQQKVSRVRSAIGRRTRQVFAPSIFWWSMQTLAKLDPGVLPKESTLAGLVLGWQNPSHVAQPEYLLELAQKCVRARGPILECGSGLTTLLCGMLAGKRGIQTWTLEHNEHWLYRTAAALDHWGIKDVHLRLAPLTEHGDFDWYDFSLNELPNDPFDLVVCDGPPGTTRGGRYGLLPLMEPHLDRHVTILLDDANRPGETEILRRWCSRGAFTAAIKPSGKRSFAVVERG